MVINCEQCLAHRKLIFLSGLQQIYNLNTITMVGSAFRERKIQMLHVISTINIL